MQSIIMVADMNCVNCAKKIEQALMGTRVKFDINIDRKIVIVDGDNDMVRLAKHMITDIGFTVL